MTNENYLPTIGLEIHAELMTESKMFCRCKNDPDEEKPNINICPVCLGQPGTLPVLNIAAIKKVLEVGVAVGGKLADFTEWDRKHYFYPDIPKGYQISQYKYPLVSDGALSGVSIERIHLEEDTAQSTHDTHEKSLVNFNRAGVPLLELVTKPVIHDAETAVRFAKELQLLLRYLGAGEANMEKGEMRVEANISVATAEDTAVARFGTKTEVKNLNSFKVVEKAIRYEIERQSSLLKGGEPVKQETRGWDDVKQETYSQRSKESSHDYRYFPDPDIPKLKFSEISDFSRDAISKSIPELPWVKRERYMKVLGMNEKEAAVFVESLELAFYCESAIETYMNDKKRVKLTVNYILSEYLGLLKKSAKANLSVNAIAPKIFAEIIELTANGDISSRGAKDLLSILVKDASISKSAKFNVKELAENHGLLQKSNAEDLSPALDKVLLDNAKVVNEFKGGKTASLQFLIGQVMKATKGAGNPEIVKKLLLEKLQ